MKRLRYGRDDGNGDPLDRLSLLLTLLTVDGMVPADRNVRGVSESRNASQTCSCIMHVNDSALDFRWTAAREAMRCAPAGRSFFVLSRRLNRATMTMIRS